MLDTLALENFVLFEKASLVFGPGLNVISGETGAGKSLIAQALALALGERASTDRIRSGAKEAIVSCRYSQVRPLLRAAGAELGDGDPATPVVFRRVLPREGRSRLTLNGQTLPAMAVRALSERLLDLSAQNEHTRLMECAYQRELLDRFGGLEKEADRFAQLFARASSLDQRLRADVGERERVRRRLAQVRDDLSALDAAAYRPDEDGTLEERIRRLSHAEAIRTLAGGAVEQLYEGEESLFDRLGAILRETEDVEELSAALREGTEALAEAQARIEEAVHAFREAASELDDDPGALDALIERAEALKRLARRLGCTGIEELPAKEAALRAEEEELASWEGDAEEIRDKLNALLGPLAEAGRTLREKRTKAAGKLAKAVDRELADLGMPEAGFSADLEPLWDEGDAPEHILRNASARGLEEVVFRLSPNPGEAASTLAETASGGEAARAMLAIKSALADVYGAPVLFFDEVDAGIGGRLGDVIGRKLRELAAARQVIAITHLPQIAACADTHLRISKQVRQGRTRARVEVLEGKARIEEVAQMIRGKDSTATTLRQAEEMLQTARTSAP